MLVCRCDGHRVYQTAAGVYSDVALHPEFPLISLFRLVHFRISGFLRILGGAGSIDDVGVYNGAALHHVSGLHHNMVDRVEKTACSGHSLPKDDGICTALFHPEPPPS